jgi:hypothetical protein
VAKRETLSEVDLKVERSPLPMMSLRSQFAEAAPEPAAPAPEAAKEESQLATQAPSPAPKKRAPKVEVMPAVTEEDLHVTTVKLPRPWYILLQDMAIDRIRNKRRGAPNVGELVREAVQDFLKKEGML